MNFDMSKIMEKAQKMQEQIKKAKDEHDKLEIKGQSGAGLINVVMNGNHEIKSVNIEEALFEEDKDVIEELFAAAVNDAVQKNKNSNQSYNLQQMAKDAGIDLPNGIDFPFKP